MSPAPNTPHRAEVEHVVRRLLYERLDRPMPRAVRAPRPLLVNVSARHCHLTPQAVETLFGPGHQLHPTKWLYQDGQFAAQESVTLIGPRSRVISNLRILGPLPRLQSGRARPHRRHLAGLRHPRASIRQHQGLARLHADGPRRLSRVARRRDPRRPARAHASRRCQILRR
jgi:hypothetical protein